MAISKGRIAVHLSEKIPIFDDYKHLYEDLSFRTALTAALSQDTPFSEAAFKELIESDEFLPLLDRAITEANRAFKTHPSWVETHRLLAPLNLRADDDDENDDEHFAEDWALRLQVFKKLAAEPELRQLVMELKENQPWYRRIPDLWPKFPQLKTDADVAAPSPNQGYVLPTFLQGAFTPLILGVGLAVPLTLGADHLVGHLTTEPIKVEFSLSGEPSINAKLDPDATIKATLDPGAKVGLNGDVPVDFSKAPAIEINPDLTLKLPQASNGNIPVNLTLTPPPEMTLRLGNASASTPVLAEFPNSGPGTPGGAGAQPSSPTFPSALVLSMKTDGPIQIAGGEDIAKNGATALKFADYPAQIPRPYSVAIAADKRSATRTALPRLALAPDGTGNKFIVCTVKPPYDVHIFLKTNTKPTDCPLNPTLKSNADDEIWLGTKPQYSKALNADLSLDMATTRKYMIAGSRTVAIQVTPRPKVPDDSATGAPVTSQDKVPVTSHADVPARPGP